MTMINNNLPITQAQKQREELESPAAAPMAAPQGTAFRGKEEDEDKNKTLKIVGTTLALAAAGIYCIKSYNQGDWNPFTTDWWKGAAKSANEAGLDKAVKGLPDNVPFPAPPAAQQTGALVENAANMKVEETNSSIQAALTAKGKSNIRELLGNYNDSGIEYADGKTLHVVKDKKDPNLLKAWIETDTQPAGKPFNKYYFNSQGEQVAHKTYYEDKAGFMTSTYTAASGNIRHNNGAGRKIEAHTIFKGDTTTKGIGLIEATTQGEKYLWTALQGDMDPTKLDNATTATQELRKAFNEKSKFGKALQAQNKWSEKQTSDIMNAFLTKFKVDKDHITPEAVKKFINEYGGKHVTVTKPALKKQSLVMAFTSDKNVLHHMTHYNADTKEVTRYSKFSKALTDALKEDVDPLTLFNADGFNISGVQKAEHGYIGQIEKFKAAKKAKDGKEMLVSTAATVKSGSNYGDNTELVLTQRTQTAHLSKDKLGSGASANIREGRAVVTTSYDIAQDDLSNPTTAEDLRKKIKGATVKKSIQPADKDPKEVFSLTFNDKKAQPLNKDAVKQDQLTVTAMLEGTSDKLGDDTAQATKTVMYLLGHTDDKFSIAADTAVAAKSGALAKDPNGYHAGYLKGLLGTKTDISDDKTMVTQLDELTPNFIKDSTSMKLIKYNDSYSHIKSETEKDKGKVRSHTTYDDNGKIKSELTFDEDSGLYLKTKDGSLKAVYGKFDDTDLKPAEKIAHFDSGSGKWHSDCETTFKDEAGSIGLGYVNTVDSANNVTWITKQMNAATIDLKDDVQTLRKYAQDAADQELATIKMGWKLDKGEVNGIKISATDTSQIYKFEIGDQVTYRRVWRDSDGGFRMGQAADSKEAADLALSGAGTVAIGRLGIDKIKHNGELDKDAQSVLQSIAVGGGLTGYTTNAGDDWKPRAAATNRAEEVDKAMKQYAGILKVDSVGKATNDSAATFFNLGGLASGMDETAAKEATGGLTDASAKASVTAAQKSIDLTLANFFLNILGV